MVGGVSGKKGCLAAVLSMNPSSSSCSSWVISGLVLNQNDSMVITWSTFVSAQRLIWCHKRNRAEMEPETNWVTCYLSAGCIGHMKLLLSLPNLKTSFSETTFSLITHFSWNNIRRLAGGDLTLCVPTEYCFLAQAMWKLKQISEPWIDDDWHAAARSAQMLVGVLRQKNVLPGYFLVPKVFFDKRNSVTR